MKKILLITTLLLASMSTFATDWTGSVDIAETSLRIVLNESGDGRTLPRSMVTETERFKALSRLMNVEMRHPGLLQGKLKPGFNWPQYEEVQRLFKKLEKKEGFWY